jgi:poly(3-hydroxybutyrate) depolymerase
MKTVFSAALRQATKLTRERNFIEATRVIQCALSGKGHAVSPGGQSPESSRAFELQAHAAGRSRGFDGPQQEAGIASARSQDAATERRKKRPLGEVLKLLRQADLPIGLDSAPFMKARRAPSAPVPDGAAYLTRTFACEAGSRGYKVFVPSHADGRTLPLIIMLHGCTQNPDDFAVGTGMNLLAEEHGFIVAYPGQTVSANQSACWNWFSLENQVRDLGEPSIIAGITRAIMAEFDTDAERVEAIVAEARAGLADSVQETQHDGSARGRAYTRTVITDACGVPRVEYWAIEGLGHAWSGGNPEGLHTDQHGPDASREMLRFFLAQPPTS